MLRLGIVLKQNVRILIAFFGILASFPTNQKGLRFVLLRSVSTLMPGDLSIIVQSRRSSSLVNFLEISKPHFGPKVRETRGKSLVSF